MAQPQTPLEIVDAMIARKRRAHQRITTAIRENAATGGRLSAYDMATEATRLADVQGAIDVLLEVREEIAALEAEITAPTPEGS